MAKTVQSVQESAIRAVVEAPGKTRDQLAAWLIGIPVDRLPALRQLALNPPTGTAKSSSKLRTAAAPVDLVRPAVGAALDARQLAGIAPNSRTHSRSA